MAVFTTPLLLMQSLMIGKQHAQWLLTPQGYPMCKSILRLLHDETGATAIEYGLIAALIAVAAVSVMVTVGQHLSTTFNTVATKL